MKIGLPELVVVFIVALFVIGPDKMPYYAKKLGEALSLFRKISGDATKEIRESIAEPLEEAQRPLREAMQPVADLEQSVQKDLKDLKKSFADIGKPDKTSVTSKQVSGKDGELTSDSVEDVESEENKSEESEEGGTEHHEIGNN